MREKQYYEVETHWGWFRLDEGAYQDYRQGKLWICWTPGQRIVCPTPETSYGDVSRDALVLREEAEQMGAYALLQRRFPGEHTSIPYRTRMRDVSIEEMTLSVRASNCLMRADVRTMGKLAALITSERGLKGLRNLGAKSEKEILRCFFTACYEKLSQGEKAVFWQEMLENQTTNLFAES